MAQFIDITGQQFNFLTVLHRNYDYAKIHNLSSTAAYWDCQCICGKVITVNGSQLRNGRKVSCGCIKRKLNDDIIQQRFGKLIVLERDYTYAKKHKVSKETSYYTCQCDCGKITTVSRKNLINGHTQSCGCLIKEKIFETNTTDLTNKKVGKLLVLERTEQKIPHGGYLWKCQCDCGNVTYVSTDKLVSNHTQSCGCLRSKGEQLITKILTENNILYKKEYSFPDLVSELNIRLRFDYAILNPDNSIKILIEYDGQQHDALGIFWGNSNEEQLKHDIQKNLYCKVNNIPLLRISWREYNKINYNYLMEEINKCIAAISLD